MVYELEFSRTGKRVEICSELHSGSNSQVFTCKSLSKKFALKKIPFTSAAKLQQIESEVNLLYAVKPLNVRLPKIEDLRVDPDSASILMSIEPGSQLNNWLALNADSLAWTDRVELAFALLLQLAPTFKSIDPILVHRNIGSHNILISIAASRELVFTLLDLGLGVDRDSWSLFRWRDTPPCGDARYWPCSAWRLLINGWSTLNDQYRDKIDMHCFALTLVETICAFTPQPALSPIYWLVNAWNAYWEDASRFACDWQEYSCKDRLVRKDVFAVTKHNLKRIRDALRSIRSEHQLFILVERMLCVDESTITADWSYVVRKLNISSGSTPAESREGTPYQKETPLDLLRVHY